MKLKSLDDFFPAKLRHLIQIDEDDQEPSLWIFGYGSLIWNPNFEYETVAKARLPGYSRRFYLANTTFRGTDRNPGRVVTLIKDEEQSTFGLAFKVRGWKQVSAALSHLYFREVKNGYLFRAVNLELLSSSDDGGSVISIPALTCIATEEDALYLGRPETGDVLSSTRAMALQIAAARGTAGPNYEYLIKLADCMRAFFPNVWDEHLYVLEYYTLQFLTTTTTTDNWDQKRITAAAVIPADHHNRKTMISFRK